MFVGHFAMAFGAKAADGRPSLGTTVAAAQLADLLWPLLLLVGWERVTIAPGDTAFTPLRFDSYPFSHSLVVLAAWAALFAGVHFAVKRRPRTAVLLFALVLSHWVLDWLTHRPDLPVVPGGARYGLGLWNHPAATMVVEIAMYVVGLALYARATRPRDRIGRHGLPILAALLAFFYAMNVTSPPPPSWRAVAVVSAMGGVLIVAAAAWIDRHREPA